MVSPHMAMVGACDVAGDYIEQAHVAYGEVAAPGAAGLVDPALSVSR